MPSLEGGLQENQVDEQDFLVDAALVRDLLDIVLCPQASTPSLGGFEEAHVAPAQVPSPAQVHPLHEGPVPNNSAIAGCGLVASTVSEVKDQKEFHEAEHADTWRGIEAEEMQLAFESIRPYLMDALQDCFQDNCENAQILHLGSGSRFGDHLQSIVPLAHVTCFNQALHAPDTSCNEMTTGLPLWAEADTLRMPTDWTGRFHCVVDDSSTHWHGEDLHLRQCCAAKLDVARTTCREVARVLRPVEGRECRPSMYIILSPKNKASLLGETFELSRVARVHLHETVLWLHIACSRSAHTKLQVQGTTGTTAFAERPVPVLEWALRPARRLSPIQLGAMLFDLESRHWSLTAPPGRFGDISGGHMALDSRAGLLHVRGIVARRAIAKSKGLIFIDLENAAGSQVKCDAEWISCPTMMPLAKGLRKGNVLDVEGVICKGVGGGQKALLLALACWQCDTIETEVRPLAS
eukprot:gnl/TRDRNA2_/TRDRNA2_127242_c1_seq1.p1 gnl/TRDRNA2_/TRDRNA2_127242_c1~~gnl/TRDRNA2_/TRDRNA2_127242_c1_seq1.p1  ORF type:complete len:495 (-),score=80.13 gnl/TRDRNA2_/TRDRNA2_127242_c1_seq1:15-1409(-)